MKKFNLIGIVFIIIISISYIFVAPILHNFLSNIIKFDNLIDDYEYGEYSNDKDYIKLKIKIDNSGRIKEVIVYDKSYESEDDEFLIQKLVSNSIDKYESSDINDEESNLALSEVYKKALDIALGYKEEDVNESYDKVTLKDPEIFEQINRNEVQLQRESVKTGFGAYIINNFTDADRNKNGNLSTHEYICAVLVEQNGRISQIKFDHISSNINYDRTGSVPIGTARAYKFISDKSDLGFTGMCSDGSFINIIELENKLTSIRNINEAKRIYGNAKGYEPFMKALEMAVLNAKYIGATKDDTLGMASYKELNRRDIINANNNDNGSVTYISNYAAMTINKELIISSCMYDMTYNKITITSDGKVLGSRDSQAYTVNELSNVDKYSKMERRYVNIKKDINNVSDYVTNYTVEAIINKISQATDDRGIGLIDTELQDYKNIDFIKVVEILSNGFIDSRKFK